MKVLAQISRILVGALFIFSGWIKANDPLGFAYKLEEYFTVLHVPWLSHISLGLSIGISTFEIALGIALLLAARMRFTSWSLLLMIIFFTFLTFYSWKFDVVKDCGCFGDFLHLKPIESFMKDLILLVFILIIFIYRNKYKPLFGERASTGFAYFGFVISILYAIYCYRHLPVKDFRPYAIGKSIPEGMKLPPDAVTEIVEFTFIYEKDGVKKNFSMNELSSMEEGWTFVDRESKVIREGDEPKIHDFSITSLDGTDVTQDVLSMKNVFLLVAYDLSHSDEDVQGRINDFVALCQRDGIEFIGLTASSKKDIDEFRHKHNSMFDYYNTDMTTLKTIIRSNPGLVRLTYGVVVGKWHHNNFPTYEEIKSKLAK